MKTQKVLVDGIERTVYRVGKDTYDSLAGARSALGRLCQSVETQPAWEKVAKHVASHPNDIVSGTAFAPHFAKALGIESDEELERAITAACAAAGLPVIKAKRGRTAQPKAAAFLALAAAKSATKPTDESDNELADESDDESDDELANE